MWTDNEVLLFSHAQKNDGWRNLLVCWEKVSGTKSSRYFGWKHSKIYTFSLALHCNNIVTLPKSWKSEKWKNSSEVLTFHVPISNKSCVCLALFILLTGTALQCALLTCPPPLLSAAAEELQWWLNEGSGDQWTAPSETAGTPGEIRITSLCVGSVPACQWVC